MTFLTSVVGAAFETTVAGVAWGRAEGGEVFGQVQASAVESPAMTNNARRRVTGGETLSFSGLPGDARLGWWQ